MPGSLERVHLLRIIDYSSHPPRGITVCGIQGWQKSQPSNEFVTVLNDRFEAHAECDAYVDCPHCMARVHPSQVRIRR